MTVYLVGAGPGDPGLLTRRGAELLGRADVVVYDRLAAPELLELAPAADHVCVAKAPGRHSVTQGDINEMLVRHGRAGRTVVRLKGGDPFVFARGGEECRALADAGVPFEVVPGISSAIAAPAYAGVPVTLRHSSTSLIIVTGHEDPGSPDSVDWRAVAAVGGTIVVLMGVARIETIAAELMAGGRSADTPVAAVRWGTRPDQRSVRATLGTIAAQDLGAPTTFVIGDVASDESTVDWFEGRPLFGITAVVTRPTDRSDALAAGLRARGAAVVSFPVVAIEAVEPSEAPDVGSYDWVAFTSANAVRHFVATLHDARAFGSARVAAIGPATADALAAAGITADLVPPVHTAADLRDALVGATPDGAGVLVPQAEQALPTLVDGLRDAGWSVDPLTVYRTVPATPDAAAVDAVSRAQVVTFASPSAVRAFDQLVPPEQRPAVVASIGPVTSAAVRDAGHRVDVEADPHTAAALVDALVRWRAGESRPR